MPLTCLVCSRPQNEVKKLIAVPATKDGGEERHICDRCVGKLHGALDEGGKANIAAKTDEVLLRKPTEIFDFLGEHVIGQERARKAIATAIYKHYKRKNAATSDIEFDKANILVLGPTGSGKSHIARTIAKLLKVPFFSGDATRLTQAGYVGDDVETLIQGLIQDADGDSEKAQWGIIFLDEIDKIARKGGRELSGYRDVSGEGVQQALLKMIEGSKISIPRLTKSQNQGRGYVVLDTVDTSNILFICSGSFAGIETIVEKRLNKNARLGFRSEDRTKLTLTDTYEHVNSDDLLEFGLIPELMGRLPVLTSTIELSEEDMVRVLTEPKHSLVKQRQALFAMDGAQLHFEHGALLAIAREAKKRPTGARALVSILEEVLAPVEFEVPSRPDIEAVFVTEDSVTERKPPIYRLRQNRLIA
jgi:ATP-dependent Clp protease ATP-binding subunit ClpX